MIWSDADEKKDKISKCFIRLSAGIGSFYAGTSSAIVGVQYGGWGILFAAFSGSEGT